MKPQPFVRDATGLVREISTLDACFMNLGFINIPLGLLTYTSAMYVFPGSDPVLATLLATFFTIFSSLMYTLFAWAMPRSGGDYIFVSRVLHPLVGFVVNFNVTFWLMYTLGVAINWVTTLALSPSLLIIGNVTSNQSLVNLANVLAQPQNVLIVGLIVIIVMGLLMVKGVRATFAVNNVMFLVSIVGVGVILWLLATNTNADFANAFSRFASYDKVIAAAHNAGYSPQGSTPFLATLGVMPFVFAATGFGIATSYFAGEVKSIKRNLLYSQLLTTVVAGIVLAILGGLALSVFGYDFLGSISQLSFTGSQAYPFSVPPYFNLFVSILTSNPAILWLVAVSFVAGIITIVPPNLLIGTRSIFAWSFDRVIPAGFATINERFHTPVYAILVVSIMEFAGLVVQTYGPTIFLSLISGGIMAEIISFMVVAIAAIVFPFRRRELYGNSPANISVVGLPLISIAGLVSLAFYVLLEYFYLTNPLYGANTSPIFGTIGISIVTPMVIFAVAYYYRRSKGLNLSLAFKELPPE